MEKETNEINWEEIMDKFSSYNGAITEFCRQNHISPHQLFYRRKRLEKESQTDFHPISLKKNAEFSCDSNFEKSKEIRIEIGKATLVIPSNETAILSQVIKEII